MAHVCMLNTNNMDWEKVYIYKELVMSGYLSGNMMIFYVLQNISTSKNYICSMPSKHDV